MTKRSMHFDLEPDVSAKVLILPQTDDAPVITLLLSMLEDARRGGITTLAAITVTPAGLVQTPAQGYQVREVARGIEALRQRISDTYDRAVADAMMNPQAPLRPMKTEGPV